jgi:hypothetical protein
MVEALVVRLAQQGKEPNGGECYYQQPMDY